MKDSVNQAARMLMAEHGQKTQFHPFVAKFGVVDLNGAYAVQREYVTLQKEQRNVRAVGYKVGLTSPRMQEMCGIDRPIGGVILEDRVFRSGATLNFANYGRLGLEFEIAVRLGRDLIPQGQIEQHHVEDAVDAVCAAVEIVDDRHCDYSTLDVLSLVADNSWNAGVILGEFVSKWPNLAEIEGRISVDGRENDKGSGKDVLGHPLQSVVWVANHLAEDGDMLRRGDIVMSGNMVTTKFPSEPSRWLFDVKALGTVDLVIAV